MKKIFIKSVSVFLIMTWALSVFAQNNPMSDKDILKELDDTKANLDKDLYKLSQPSQSKLSIQQEILMYYNQFNKEVKADETTETQDAPLELKASRRRAIIIRKLMRLTPEDFSKILLVEANRYASSTNEKSWNAIESLLKAIEADPEFVNEFKNYPKEATLKDQISAERNYIIGLALVPAVLFGMKKGVKWSWNTGKSLLTRRPLVKPEGMDEAVKAAVASGQSYEQAFASFKRGELAHLEKSAVDAVQATQELSIIRKLGKNAVNTANKITQRPVTFGLGILAAELAYAAWDFNRAHRVHPGKLLIASQARVLFELSESVGALHSTLVDSENELFLKQELSTAYANYQVNAVRLAYFQNKAHYFGGGSGSVEASHLEVIPELGIKPRISLQTIQVELSEVFNKIWDQSLTLGGATFEEMQSNETSHIDEKVQALLLDLFLIKDFKAEEVKAMLFPATNTNPDTDEDDK